MQKLPYGSLISFGIDLSLYAMWKYVNWWSHATSLINCILTRLVIVTKSFVVIFIRKVDTKVDRLLMKAIRHHLSDKDQVIDLITKHLHNNSLRVLVNIIHLPRVTWQCVKNTSYQLRFWYPIHKCLTTLDYA